MVDQKEALRGSLIIVRKLQGLLRRGLFRGADSLFVHPGINYMKQIENGLRSALNELEKDGPKPVDDAKPEVSDSKKNSK
jgi:hypothetical protein